MASLKLNLVVATTTIVVAYMHFSTTTAYTTYVVGGARGWIVPPKPDHYEAWTKGKKFIKNDGFWFLFIYLNHTVEEVNSKEEYDTCNATGGTKVLGPIEGSTWIQLDEAKVHYFFCALHCAKGQKVIIDVKES